MVRIRPAEAAETPEVARVWEVSWRDAHAGRVPDALLAERTTEYFTEHAAEFVGSTLVAVDDEAPDVLLGVALVDREELCQLAVTSTAQGRGIGAALVTAAEELIGAHHDRAELAVMPDNVAARRLYERCGWQDLGEVTMNAPTLPDRDPIPVVVRHYVKQLR